MDAAKFRIAQLEQALERERMSHAEDARLWELERSHLCKALFYSDTRSLAMRSRSVASDEVAKFQKIAVKLRNDNRALRAALQALEAKRGAPATP